MILSRVENSVREYASEYPCIDYKGIVNRFGTPQQIAESYIAEMNTAELLQGMRIRDKVLLIVLATAALLSIVRFGFLAAGYYDHAKDMSGYAVVEVIEVDRTKINEGGKENE